METVLTVRQKTMIFIKALDFVKEENQLVETKHSLNGQILTCFCIIGLNTYDRLLTCWADFDIESQKHFGPHIKISSGCN